MEGGFFLAPADWELLLPAGVEALATPRAAAARRWDMLALTALGCRLLAGRSIRARVLLLPGEWSGGGFQAETVVTYGLSPRDSITFSSLTEPVLCLQRAVPGPGGRVLEPQEFPLSGVGEAQGLLPCVAARLLWTGRPCPDESS